MYERCHFRFIRCVWALNSDPDMLNREAWESEISHIHGPLANTTIHKIMPSHHLDTATEAESSQTARMWGSLTESFQSKRPAEVLWSTKLGLISSDLLWASSELSPPCTWQLPSVPSHHQDASQLPQAPPTLIRCLLPTSHKTKWSSAVLDLLNELAHSTSNYVFGFVCFFWRILFPCPRLIFSSHFYLVFLLLTHC